MTGFNSKRQMAQAKVTDESDTLTIVYQRGFADGKRSAERKPLTEEQQAEPVAWNAGVAPMWPQQKEGETFLVSYTITTPPQQQAEPVAMRMPRVGDKVICLEDESLGTIVSLTAGGSPDIVFDDGSRGTYMLREFAELFSYVAPPQRPWVRLTDDDWDHIADKKGTSLDTFEQGAVWAANQLKERNT